MEGLVLTGAKPRVPVLFPPTFCQCPILNRLASMWVYTHFGGFESTQMFGSGEDILGSTRHIELWEEDLNRLCAAGITSLRYSVPWHRIERAEGEFDWTWIDGPLRFMHANGMEPILDPLHHTSFPAWLKGGFLNAKFPSVYCRFLDKLSSRYPFFRDYTVFNEPLPTTLFCSYTGMWYPHQASDQAFVTMLLQVARAICSGCEVLRKNVSPRFVHVDTAEHHQALDRRSSAWVDFVNARRFLVTDLILGLVTEGHPLYAFLTHHGAAPSQLSWFHEHLASIDVLGLDYYIHSEMDWSWSREKSRPDIAPTVRHARGFATIAEDYFLRYGKPIMLAETNIVGSVEERIAWLRFMECECEELALSGIDFRGFCWYPSIDTTDWSNGCTRATGQLDPQGIWSLRPIKLDRIDTELSTLYSMLARGMILAEDLPDYSFGPELQRRLNGYMHLPSMWKDRASRAS